MRDEYQWDVFVSHAREDKVPFVRDLVAALRSRGLRVWFDEEVLTIGDSLRRAIDAGLRRSRFGVVVLSPHFFAKEWTQKELDALKARDDGREKVILPVWHDVSFADVVRFSPLLADKLALSSSEGVSTLALAVAIAALAFAEARKHGHASRAAGTALSRIRNSRRLIAGCISQPPLLDFVLDGGQISAVGLYARLAEEVAILEGLTIEYVGLRFSQMVDAIESHQVDVVLCTFPTPETIAAPLAYLEPVVEMLLQPREATLVRGRVRICASKS